MAMARRVGAGNVRPREEREHADITGRQLIEFPRRRRPLRLPDEPRLSRAGFIALVLALAVLFAGVAGFVFGRSGR